MSPLPIEALVPALVEALRSQPNMVLQAEPGAGKTTHIPRVLLDAGFAEHGEILITQPRRLAARMAAHRIASQLGEAVGGRCGYQVRFESKVSARTRLRFMTEGMLTRRLRADPRLAGVSTVILDEFHERHLSADVALALLRRLQSDKRPDLRLLVMSATLDADPVATFLGCSVLTSPGRQFPVEVSYVPRTSERPIHQQVADAVRDTLALRPRGGILVFLPGAKEIRDTWRSCEALARNAGFETYILHGELSPAEQDRVTAPASKPRLILSTNVAETSVTLEGIETVIDSGLVRRPTHNPWTGIQTLSLTKTSQASARQRAGRAGRTGPGHCVRLYPQHDFDRRPAFDPPEITRLDLAEVLLDLHAHGIASARTLAWLEPPPLAAIEAAETLLRRLGAVDELGRLLPAGRRSIAFPTHPRLATLLLESVDRGIPDLACAAAALLAERPLRRDTDGRKVDAEDADVLRDLRELDGPRGDPGIARTVQLARRQLRSLLPKGPLRELSAEARGEALCQALMRAFPDRVARRRGGTDVYVFADGGSARLAMDSVVHQAEWIVALVAEERRQPGKPAEVVIRSAAQIESDWLLEAFSDEIAEVVDVRFDANSERVDATEELRFGALTVERRALSSLPESAAAVLFDAARERGYAAFVDEPELLEQLTRRFGFARRFDPSIPELSTNFLETHLAQMCRGRKSFAELRAAGFVASLRAVVPPEAFARMDALAPTHVPLPSGRRLTVCYEVDRDPWTQSHLQDFFGSSRGPTVAQGRIPLVLHLLAPNRRPVQVTTDLAGFWERHYPDLRRALMRRYPRHAWPDDPTTAVPPAPRQGGRR